MQTLFENNDFILKSTGHDYDFVGIIETKTYEPLTFFFEEHTYEETIQEDDYCSVVETYVDEDETKLIEVHRGLKEYNPDSGDDEEEDIALMLDAQRWLRTRDDGSTGFLSNPEERGMFLALVKAYCPEKLDRIPWA